MAVKDAGDMIWKWSGGGIQTVFRVQVVFRRNMGSGF